MNLVYIIYYMRYIYIIGRYERIKKELKRIKNWVFIYKNFKRYVKIKRYKI